MTLDHGRLTSLPHPRESRSRIQLERLPAFGELEDLLELITLVPVLEKAAVQEDRM